jgi:ribonucleoside-diphosphate reductase alpha chain
MNTRNAVSWSATVGGTPIDVSLRFGPRGEPTHIRAVYGKVGNDLQAHLDAVLEAISIGLQAGVPLEAYVKTLAYRRFAPKQTKGEGSAPRPTTGDPLVPYCTSVVDYAVRSAAARVKQDGEVMAEVVRAAGEAGACGGE